MLSNVGKAVLYQETPHLKNARTVMKSLEKKHLQCKVIGIGFSVQASFAGLQKPNFICLRSRGYSSCEQRKENLMSLGSRREKHLMMQTFFPWKRLSCVFVEKVVTLMLALSSSRRLEDSIHKYFYHVVCAWLRMSSLNESVELRKVGTFSWKIRQMIRFSYEPHVFDPKCNILAVNVLACNFTHKKPTAWIERDPQLYLHFFWLYFPCSLHAALLLIIR